MCIEKRCKISFVLFCWCNNTGQNGSSRPKMNTHDTFHKNLPNSSSRWVARYICLSFWSCFSIFLLASLCAFSSFRWSSVLLLPRQPIFPKTQWWVQGEAGWLVRWVGGWVQAGRVGDEKKIFNPKFLDWPSRGTPGSKWVTFMLPDADGTDSSRRWASPGFGTIMDGWMWLFAGDLSIRNLPERSRETMPPSQKLDPCVFHCKSAMKSSTLIREWMWNVQPRNALEWMSVVLFLLKAF